MKKIFAALVTLLALNGCCSNGRVMPEDEIEGQARHLEIHSLRN